jgi:hypothetical protein
MFRTLTEQTELSKGRLLLVLDPPDGSFLVSCVVGGLGPLGDAGAWLQTSVQQMPSKYDACDAV